MSKKRTKTAFEYQERLRYIRQFKTSKIRSKKNFQPSQKGWITREFRKLKLIDNVDHVFIQQSKTKLKQFKQRGHYTTTKGIFLPRIKTDKLTQKVVMVTPEIVTYKIGNRIDIQYNFTKKEKINVLKNKSIQPYINKLKAKIGNKYRFSVHFVFTGNNGSLEFTLPELADNYLSAISQSGEKWLTGIRLVGFKKKRVTKKK